MSTPESSFLSHVAGLRGWAILLIVWFHLTAFGSTVPEWLQLPCGYFGVEAFLVIMGYFCISGFVRKGEVPLLPYLEGKFMRLLVPTAVIVLSVLAAGLFTTDCTELEAMSKTATAALYGTANHQLIRSTTSYFATGAACNPFLHFWYLSVSVQLFALSYAGYFILKRFSRKTVIIVLAVVSALSFLYSLADVVRELTLSWGLPALWKAKCVSYYATMPRIWEFLAGGAVLLLPEVTNRRKASALALSGFAVFLAAACYHGESAQALSIPVVVAVILIIRYGAAGLTGALLNNPLALWLGGISTSLYLVHMPLLALWKQWTFRSPSLSVCLMLLGVSLLCAWCFCRAVEKRRFTLRMAVLIWGTAMAAALVGKGTHGLQNIWDKDINAVRLQEYTDYQINMDASLGVGFDADALLPEQGWLHLSQPDRKVHLPAMELPLVHLGPQGTARFVLIGDSHAQALYMGMDAAAGELGIPGVFLGSIIEPFINRTCPPIARGYYYNREKALALFRWLDSHPEIENVVIAIRWTKLMQRDLDWDMHAVPPTTESNGAALREFCTRLRSHGKKITIWAPLPSFEGAKTVSYARWLKRHGHPLHAMHPEYICTREAYEAEFGAVNKLFNDMEKEGLCHVLRPADTSLFRYDATLGKHVCRAVDSGCIAFSDDNHISVPTSLRLCREMKEQIREFLMPADSRGDRAEPAK